ncbi:MAG: thioesterase [Myxococcales bacterium]|nr:thioesterase [Myxococcales bacterium]
MSAAAMVADPAWPRARIFCCPYAGGSSLAYRRWADGDPDVEVVSLDYPGRLQRDDEPMLRSVAELAASLFEDIADKLDRPAAIVGSSLGGLVAFELVRLAERRGIRIAVLVVCACAAPARLQRRQALADLDDDAFVAGLTERYGGAFGAVAADPEARELFLPILRADIETFEAYAGTEVTPIRAEIIAVRGEADRAVSFADVAAWRACSSGAVQLLAVPGDHFFVQDRPSAVLHEIRSRLTRAPGRKDGAA